MTVEEHRRFLEQDFDDVTIEELKDISRIGLTRAEQWREKRSSTLEKSGTPIL